MSDLCYDKTEKGREEILSRKYQLATRLRSLLVIIDGKQNQTKLLAKVAALGLNQSHLEELADQGYIELKPVKMNEPAPETGNQSLADNTEAAVLNAEAELPPAAVAALLTRNTQYDGLSDSERYQAVYQFYTETIKANLGLRGFTLQLKVEKAANLQQLQELRVIYLEAIIKAKGREMARALRDRLDSLLGESTAFDI